MNRQFDLVVLGTGSAGSTAARACRAAGWSVAIVDSRPFGGTCVLRGCDPKKMLVGAAELVDWSRRMRAKGVVTSELQISWPALMAFKHSFTDPVPKQREDSYEKAGIVTFHGHARFVGRTSVSVGDDVLDARHVVIATGRKPAPLGLAGEAHLLTSDQFLELEQLPQRLVFVGGGYISFEFAHIAARAGAQARIVHRGARPLPRFEPDLVARVVSASRAAGIDIQLNTKVTGIERRGGHTIVHATELDREVEFETDVAIHGAGRVPDVDELSLDIASVEFDKSGVKVNEFLQSTTNPAVYAAGDAADGGGWPLTPVAGTEGEIVAENLLKGNHRQVDFTVLASTAFTIPPLASVGLNEAQADERGLKYRVSQGDTAGWYSSRRLAVDFSAYKVLVEENTDRILGAHILGPHAEEQINVLALAMRANISAAVIKDVLYAYPTGSSDLEYMV
jgi:glutathione reductase (NADPH)